MKLIARFHFMKPNLNVSETNGVENPDYLSTIVEGLFEIISDDKMESGNSFSMCKTTFFLLLMFESIVLAAAISRDDFPSGFFFGAGTSAYQVEGAAAEDGRKRSIWDTFTHAGLSDDQTTGDIAADQYHKYKEDVKLMHDMGLDAYRFSISWPRLIPDGHGPVNAKGLQYYNNLIDELVSYGIEPHVTLHHFDLPQALEDEYGGVLSPRIVEDFTAYANICFRELGDRVKYWATFNEPKLQALLGYKFGAFPPQHCTHPVGSNCTKGGSTSEPYLAAHNLLRSHLSAATLYKDQYQAEQGGKIGITISCPWFSASTNSQEDIIAAQLARDYNIGWIINPLVYGDYPPFMRESLGSNLPSFDVEESMKLKQSFDFIGLNHYNMFYVKYYSNSYDKGDKDVKNVSVKVPDIRLGAWEKFFTVEEVPNAPWALRALLEYFKIKYRNPPVIIYENGYGELNVGPNTGNGTDDYKRVAYLQDYIESLLQSIRNGSNTLGYFVWSFLDCFELTRGYTARCGLYGVDFKGADRRRFARLSAHWYSNFLSNGGLGARVSKTIHTE